MNLLCGTLLPNPDITRMEDVLRRVARPCATHLVSTSQKDGRVLASYLFSSLEELRAAMRPDEDLFGEKHRRSRGVLVNCTKSAIDEFNNVGRKTYRREPRMRSRNVAAGPLEIASNAMRSNSYPDKDGVEPE